MACPFFMPTVRLEGAFKFPDRLPLPPGFNGVCGAPGQMLAHPTEDELRDHCNLGHAACPRLPEQRQADSVRFSARSTEHHRISVCYVYEKDCRPAGGGVLEYDERERRWISAIDDEKLQRQADCFLQTWRSRQRPVTAAAAHS
jgi:hypothetical protein